MGGYTRFEQEIARLSLELGGSATVHQFIEFASEVLETAIKNFGFHVRSDFPRRLDDVLDLASDEKENMDVVKWAWLDEYLHPISFATDWIKDVFVEEKATAAYCRKNYIKSRGNRKRDKARAQAFACAIRIVAKNLPLTTGRIDFRYSPDFHSVVLRAELFSLSPMEARVIEFLYQLCRDGTPSVSLDSILAEVGSKKAKTLRDCFTHREAYKALIRKDGSNFRLNI
jgi:hypothetical protein